MIFYVFKTRESVLQKCPALSRREINWTMTYNDLKEYRMIVVVENSPVIIIIFIYFAIPSL